MTVNSPGARQFQVFVACLLAVLLWFFWRSFEPAYVVFSNDGPLGAQNQNAIALPEAFFGVWYDLNFIGTYGGSFSPTLTNTLLWLLGPVYFAKFYVPIILLLLGLSVWLAFRRVGLAPVACTLGALAAALNSDFFSTAAWGVGPQVVTMSLSFLAIAALSDTRPGKEWVKVILAGFAVGMGVMEGADIGALFSLVVALFIVYQALSSPARLPAKLGRGFLRLAVVSLCAAFMATQALTALIGTQIKGIVGTSQDAESKMKQWDWATQWSLPKREVLGLFVPGLFGYRMDTPMTLPDSYKKSYEGGNYWGLVGSHRSYERHRADPTRIKLQPGDLLRVSAPENSGLDTMRFISGTGEIELPVLGNMKAAGLTPAELEKAIINAYAPRGTLAEVNVAIVPQSGARFSGGGGYAGVLVVLVALWASFQSLRKQGVFTPAERKLVWFWSAALVISVLLAFGRFAPFYQVVYALPYFSTIRNPTKFLHIFSFAVIWLFAFGIHGLSRAYLESALANTAGLGSRLKTWWHKGPVFDRRWIIACGFALVISLAGWAVFASSRESFEQYLQSVEFSKDISASIASFSLRQVGWFIFLLTGCTVLLALILAGTFAGRRAKWAGLLLGTLLVIDLVPAAIPWLVFWNYKDKYATNPIIEHLRQQPHLQRAAKIRFPLPRELQIAGLFSYVYDIEWIQQLFQYYNIQSVDIIQRSRLPQDIAAYESTFEVHEEQKAYLFGRRWQLTNTRYLLGPVGFFNVMNMAVDPGKQRFTVATRFNLVPKSGVRVPEGLSFEQLQVYMMRGLQTHEITVQLSPDGLYALYDFTGALPRAKLYSDWQVPIKTPAASDEIARILQSPGGEASLKTGTNDVLTLRKLAAADFDPLKTVLLADTAPVPEPAANPNPEPGTVEFASYAPKRVVLKTKAGSASVLLLNDKYDPSWRVFVDGKPETLLRANFIMRGVHVPPGEHTVEFQLHPPQRPIYASLAAIAIGLLLIVCLIIPGGRERSGAPDPEPASGSKHPAPSKERSGSPEKKR